MNVESLRKLLRELTDKGKLIEAGWIGLRIAAVNSRASEIQLEEMRMAFFAGAQHLYISMMTFLESGDDATEKDLNRMESIHNELQEFIVDFSKRHGLSDDQNYAAEPPSA